MPQPNNFAKGFNNYPRAFGKIGMSPLLAPMALYAFDGTWNEEKDAGRYDLNTNVVRFKDLYAGKKFFYQGVGTKHGTAGKFIGGAFGVGGHDRIEDAKRDLSRQLAAGDRDIDIVGFSRGAALAVHFANVVGDGIRVGDATEVPPVRFLGVFDIVAAFGIPIDIGLSFNRINLGYKLGLAKVREAVLSRASRSMSRARLSGPRACAAVAKSGSAACTRMWVAATTITR